LHILKICYEYPPLGGGGGHVVKGLSRQLSLLGYHVDLVTMKFKGLAGFERSNNLSIYRVPTVRSNPVICHPHEMITYLLCALPKALKLSREKKYNIIHAHFIFPDGILAYLVSKLTGIPYVITSHGSDVPGYNPDRFVALHTLLRPVWKTIVRSSSQVVCLSRYLESLLKSALPGAHTTIIPNGFPVGRFRKEATGDFKKLSRVLVVTRMFKRKGIQHFLEAVDGLNLDLEIHIAGDGPYLNELKRQAKSISADIRFHGFVENDSQQFRDLMASSQIFILPSESDNFPISLLEAMDAGMAIITTRDTGCEEVIGDAGLLVSPGDVKGIRDALLMLSNAPDLCRKKGDMARKRLEENFSWEAVTKKYILLYEKIVM